MRKIATLFILLLFTVSCHVFAANQTYTCTGTDDQDGVAAKIALMSAGETLTIEAGNCTFTDYVSIATGITVTGVGLSTVINSTGGRIFLIPTTATGDIRITNMRFTGSSSGGTDIRIERGWDSLRIDHITVNTTSTTFADIGYSTHWDDLFSGVTTDSQKVLFDHITYSTTTGGAPVIKIYGRGHRAWQEDDGWGTDNFVFIEDSTFTWPSDVAANSKYVTDTEFGARFVFRYNTVTNGGVFTHDTGSTPRSRGTRAVELYNNTMTSAVSGDTYALNFLRGGTGIAYNNSISGYTNLNNPMIYRVSYNNSFLYPAYCTDTGSTKVCQDTARHCSGGDNAGKPCTQAYECPNGTCNTAYTCTTNADCKDYDGVDGLCMQIDGSSDDGYPCRDQLGRGKDDAETGVQASSPLFWYNNTVDDTPNTAFSVGGYGAYIQENRDYCNHDTTTSCNGVTVSYTAYTYPHPLQNATYYDVTASIVSGSGSVSPLGVQPVLSGEDSPTFTATPYNGWQHTWGGTCGATGSASTYQKTNVTEACTVTVTFTEIQLMPW